MDVVKKVVVVVVVGAAISECTGCVFSSSAPELDSEATYERVIQYDVQGSLRARRDGQAAQPVPEDWFTRPSSDGYPSPLRSVPSVTN